VKLRVATCTHLPEADADEVGLMAGLADAGIDASLVAWDDPSADWTTPVPTILRSTWNYARQCDAFLAWVDRVASAAPLWNPREVVRDNVRKRYLLALAKRGVPVVPTQIVARGAAAAASLPDGRIVIKPEIGAGSLNTRAFAPDQRDGARAHLAMITAHGDALVQPYVASVDGYGERSLIWIDGELTHAMRKTPRCGGYRAPTEGPCDTPHDERAVADAALAPYREHILYGRVDLARDDAGQPMVMELELVEPSLFLTRHPPALARFVAAVERVLAASA
jgi:glutathione synthase/RimK-type ligase-like ATP-grasp enzyme